MNLMRRFLGFTSALLVSLCLALPLAADAPLFRVPVTDLQGKVILPAQLNGRVTAVIIANRDNADQAAVIGQEIVFKYGANKDFAFVTLADLRGVPSFARNYVTGLIEDKIKVYHAQLVARVTKAGRTYVQEYWFYIPDWDSRVTLEMLKASPLNEYAIFDQQLSRLNRYDREKAERQVLALRNHIHVFILDQQGHIKAHYLDQGATGQAMTLLGSLLEK